MQDHRKPNAATDPGTLGPPAGSGATLTTGLNRWLARLSLSLVIVSAALAYQGYRTLVTGATGWRAGVDLFAAAAALALAFAGVRERHRTRPS